mmetsp:Transcript_8208/g.34468  ORF Transcript_8208/g.34468 Transcript_8208/m.34468 type:complete len:226 (-) Transcript_8208:74-751(-)
MHDRQEVRQGLAGACLRLDHHVLATQCHRECAGLHTCRLYDAERVLQGIAHLLVDGQKLVLAALLHVTASTPVLVTCHTLTSCFAQIPSLGHFLVLIIIEHRLPSLLSLLLISLAREEGGVHAMSGTDTLHPSVTLSRTHCLASLIRNLLRSTRHLLLCSLDHLGRRQPLLLRRGGGSCQVSFCLLRLCLPLHSTLHIAVSIPILFLSLPGLRSLLLCRCNEHSS